MAGYGETALVKSLSFLAEKQASISNNLANVDTTAFKRRAAIAQDTGPKFHTLLDRNLRSVDYVEKSDMERGVLRETGNRFDVAVDGDAWMRVQRGEDQYYTRNGRLQIGSDGFLVTNAGDRVLNQDGNPIQIGTGAEAPSDLQISPNGAISNPFTGQGYGTLALLDLDNPEAMVPIGQGLYTDPSNQAGTQSGGSVRQGFLEGSNVDSLQELVAMITVERTFSATQSALTGINRLQENMITNILR
ncbi:MAG: flagellar hook-basal body protein [Planctomycetota bacterium]